MTNIQKVVTQRLRVLKLGWMMVQPLAVGQRYCLASALVQVPQLGQVQWSPKMFRLEPPWLVTLPE